MTLNQTLQALGLTKRKAAGWHSTGTFHILRQGAVVFTGDASETWAWLRAGRLVA
jgi:hypothetical protein